MELPTTTTLLLLQIRKSKRMTICISAKAESVFVGQSDVLTCQIATESLSSGEAYFQVRLVNINILAFGVNSSSSR